MRHVTLHITLTIIFCSFALPLIAADTLIYSNTTTSNSYLPQSAYEENIDYGTTAGGRVTKFTIQYATAAYNPGTVTIRFYSGTYRYDEGYTIATFELTGLSGSPNGNPYLFSYNYVIPEANQFNLPVGNFGYSYEFENSNSGPALARDGSGNENYMLYYNGYFWDWFQINGAYAGIYMKVYTGPPINEITCDISGYKFNDINGNTFWEAGEPALPGWDIYLDTNTNGAYEESEPNVVTDPNGFYFFENVASPATYHIREIIKDGWTQTLPGSGSSYEYTLVTEPNTLYEPYNFGNTVQLFNASISGTLFYDSNGNSARDAGESGLANWRVYIDTNGNDHYNAGEPTALTNASGNYQITGLSTGVYRVAEEMQDGWVQTYPTATCTHTVTINASGQTISGINFGNHTFPGYGGGSGTLASPYLIYNHLHLQAIGTHKADWGKYFKLMANIDLSKYSGDQFNLIGRYNFADQTTPFSGDFDGNGYTISNFTYNYTLSPQEYIGLFGYVWYGDIKNLRMQNININTQGGGVDSGALVGRLYTDSTISDCHVSQGSVTVDSFGAAGLIGYIQNGIVTDCSVTGLNVTCNTSGAGGITSSNYDGNISNCSFEGTVYGQQDVGGLAGINGSVISRCYVNANVNGFQDVGGLVGSNSGTISQCYSQGTVQTHTDPQYGLAGNSAGGLVGYLSDGEISDSYSMAAVSSTSKVGGLVGLCWGDTTNPGYITHCYAAGAVSGSSTLGGLIGWNIDGLAVITGCFWDKQTTGRTTSNGGTGLLTVDMQNKQTYLTAGWDFAFETENGDESIWYILPDQYPQLSWKNGNRYEAGDGTQENPYQIWSAAQMCQIGQHQEDWSSYFILMADINLSAYPGTSYPIIGTTYLVDAVKKPFLGEFNGNGHSISNFTYQTTATMQYVGLFGAVNGGGIKNLRVINPNINVPNADYVGAIAGRIAMNVTVRDCDVLGGSVLGDTYTGGLVGYSDYGIIGNCSNTAAVSGYDDVGGIAGYAKGSSSLFDSYSTGSVTASDTAGGLVGELYSSTRVARCYSTGPVSGYNAGGLVGTGGKCIRCFWDINTSGRTNSAGGVGLPTADLKQIHTFIGWGCPQIWVLNTGVDYPRLSRQNTPGNLLPIPTYGGGNGSQESPYLIYTAEQFNDIGNYECHQASYFTLMADIILDPSVDDNYCMISPNYSFYGVFDGNYHKIVHPRYSQENPLVTSTGIFSTVNGTSTANAVVKNLGIEDPIISSAGLIVGGLAGTLYRGSIENCYVKGGSVTGAQAAGGLVGDAELQSSNLIRNSYSQTTVSGVNYAGGLAAYFSAGTIEFSYAAGPVSGSGSIGGLTGYYSSQNTTITNSVYDMETTGQSGGQGTPLSTMQMKALSSYTNWNLDTVWRICDGLNYPRLQWEARPVGDFACPDGVGIEDFVQLAQCWNAATELQADISGDQAVDLADVAALGTYWMQIGCSACGGKDISGDGNVNIADLEILIDEWMLREIPACSIADLSDDGLVGIEDLMFFCDNWLVLR
jgi:hypothetical protein